ncbi:AmmeMemoRadiSam system protein B [Candidatus Fermentibacteria bacterium]|nr:MAG: AmmeMemoRadiSam system protein B [Candidatus Fermentibacteria bacterium]
MADILRAAFAGSFYPVNRMELLDMVTGFLDTGVSPVAHSPGMVVPHAGYIYSGRTAGLGFSHAPDSVKTVVVCAPSHRYPFNGAAVLQVDGVETPLGVCSVNREAADALAESTSAIVLHEHSFEVMVPFIQLRWPEAEVVPLITGIGVNCARLAEKVMDTAENAYFIASSDLSHFHPLETAEKLDRKAIDGFLTMNPALFERSLSEGAEACGRDPVLTLMHLGALKGCTRAMEISYSTSADAGAGTEEVVGYFAGMVTE